MKFFKYILLLLALNFSAQNSKIYKKLPVKNNRLAQSVGTLVYNNFSANSWSYTGVGSMANGTTSLTLTGGDGALNNIATYTALTTALQSTTVTARIKVSNTSAANGLVAIGFKSIRDASLRHYVAVDCRSTANKGNVLIYYNNAFNSMTSPSFLPFTSGDVLEFVIEQTLTSIVFKVKNYTTGSSYLSLTLTMSITFGGSNGNIPDIFNISIWNHSGTNELQYLNYASNEYKYADVLFIGDSKTQGFYASSKANRYTDLYSTSTGKKIVNVGAQSCALQHYVELNKLVYALRPKVVVMCAAFRNNISAGTFNATNQAYYINITKNAEACGAIVYHLKPLPETTLDQSTGLTFITNSFAPNRILDISSTFVPASNTSDGVHPNVLGNALLGTNSATTIPKFFYK